MRPDDLLELFEIDPAATALPANARPEPRLSGLPFLVEFDDVERLDPARATAGPEISPAPARRRMLPFAWLGALAIHLLPLLVLLDWSRTPAAVTPPIPVQLVLEAPPPPPPPAPRKAPPPTPEKPPPPGRLASANMGEPASQPERPAAVAPPTAQPEKTQPEKTQVAVAPPPKLIPPPAPSSALPKPAPIPQPPVTPREAKPTEHSKPPVKHTVAARLPNPYPAPRATHVPGPAATRDEYLAYCMVLVNRYRGILPLSLVGSRHGETVLSITVLDDGTIANIAVKHSSGYHDIDARVEQMVAAVHRFPPLPQWIQASRVMLDFTMPFPAGLLER